ncbi:LPXTG-motif cell wall-anchored protein [Staphylococcus hominis]
MTKSPFNYVDQFALHANRSVTYYAPFAEDLADIAVTTECQDDCGCPVDPENPDQPSNPDQSQGKDDIDTGFNHDENGNPIQPNNDVSHHNNSDKANNKFESKDSEKQLPDTGNNSNNEGTLIGSLLAIVGSLFVFGRRKNKQNAEK